MSWIISNALMVDYANWRCSQALGEESLEDTCLDGEQSVQSSGIPTQPVYLSPDKMTAFSRLSRFGMMCKPLTADRGEDLLTWYLEGSRAKTLALPEKAQGLMENDQDYGQSSPASLAKYDRATHSLKTAQLSLIEDLTGYCVTLPRWGSMLDGELFQQPIATPPICESASGLWQTPTVCGNYNRKGASKTSGDGLATAVNMSLTRINLDDTAAQTATARTFPTPTATAHKGWSKGHNRANTDDRIDYTIEREASQSGQTGRLNPMWVEWLMGWPLGWTELKPLAMDKFQCARLPHSNCSLGDNNIKCWKCSQ